MTIYSTNEHLFLLVVTRQQLHGVVNYVVNFCNVLSEPFVIGQLSEWIMTLIIFNLCVCGGAHVLLSLSVFTVGGGHRTTAAVALPAL